MSTITTDVEGFKKLTLAFIKAAPTANIESLDNGWKCLALAYLGIKPCPQPQSLESITAVSTLNFASLQYNKRRQELICTGVRK